MLIGIIVFVVYAYITIWWQQVTFTLLYDEMNINFDKTTTEEERFKMLFRVLFISFLWPISMPIAIKKAGLTKVATSMTSYEWSMMLNKHQRRKK